jgi:SAM-dependent methyltransferase
VLDVGCGNGVSTASLARHSAEVVGIDYSAAMIERARREFPDLDNARFEVGDVLELGFDAASFDVVVTQRCLINLTSWEDQQKAIRNIARVLKPGGCFFLQEGTQQGRRQLNEVRQGFGLPAMPPVAFNLDFDETVLWSFLRGLFEIVEVRRFGLYDLVSRVVHPLLVSPEEPRYDAKINEIARGLAATMRGTDELSREFSAFLRRLDAPPTLAGT